MSLCQQPDNCQRRGWGELCRRCNYPRVAAMLRANYADPVRRAELLAASHGLSLWTPEEDEQLLTMRAEGRPYAEIGTTIGRDPRASAARFYRLKNGIAR